MDFCRAGHGREVVSLCPRSRIKNEHKFGMFAVEMHWKTLQPETRGLHLGSVETDHLRSDIRYFFEGNLRTPGCLLGPPVSVM